MCDTFMIKFLPPPDNQGLLPNPKETYDLKLSAVASNIWSFCIATRAQKRKDF